MWYFWEMDAIGDLKPRQESRLHCKVVSIRETVDLAL